MEVFFFFHSLQSLLNNEMMVLGYALASCWGYNKLSQYQWLKNTQICSLGSQKSEIGSIGLKSRYE